jgi:hypothetical protein
VTQRIVFEKIVKTEYGYFELVWRQDTTTFDGDFGRTFAGQVNGLVGAASGEGLYINLGRPYMGSAVRIVEDSSEPSLPDESWEDVVEVSVSIPSDAVPRCRDWWAASGDESAAGQEGLLDLTSGNYRVRVSARNRDRAATDPFAEDALDAYLIQLWPADLRPDAILRTTSANAAYWHTENGNHRWPRASPT